MSGMKLSRRGLFGIFGGAAAVTIAAKNVPGAPVPAAAPAPIAPIAPIARLQSVGMGDYVPGQFFVPQYPTSTGCCYMAVGLPLGPVPGPDMLRLTGLKPDDARKAR
jgi:hypothetical protein